MFTFVIVTFILLLMETKLDNHNKYVSKLTIDIFQLINDYAVTFYSIYILDY